MAPSQSGIGWMLSSLWPTGSSHGSIRHHSSSTSAAITNNNEKPAAVRIGIVGGGIMGITVANSLIESLQKKNDPRLPNLQIIMLEGDHQGGGGMTEFNQNKHGPDWKAATARNANTIAVGASMHVLSTRPLVYSLLSNGIKDAIGSLQRQLFGQSNNTSAEASNKATKTNHSNPELFAKPPPFFAVKPYYCLGPPATWNERLAFVNFGLHFWYTALVHGGRTDAKARAQTLVQLAKATRHKFVQEIAPKHGCTSNWYAEGLLSVHRTEQAAQHALDECHEYGLPARKLSWDEAIQREPRLQRLPIDSLYAVLRPLDIAANCEQYTRLLLDKCQQYHNDDDDNDNGGVHFDYSSDRGKVTRIDYDANDDGSNGTYTIQQESGRSTQVDVVVLAAGAETPLLAQTLGVASQIPTYPLRGFSYTAVVAKLRSWGHHHSSSNQLLQSAIAMDNLYMSSVKPWMARLTGFGELAGFQRQQQERQAAAPSEAPRVLNQYAQALFGDIAPDKINIAPETAIPCLRPMSPDDLPIVGALVGRTNGGKKMKGLFVHTGHGTLGWTTAYATADCCAQDILDYLLLPPEKKDGDDSSPSDKKAPFSLPDGSTLDRKLISPSRFQFGWFASP
ncbi:unnamed protein product [Cylindrotheca closterium]|uniref:FAD dependent oxidoreductase domain-containing protein n=1 Tax=Cylindrotheca closterium TaxID=2856 RepID=A0AAD2FLX4_9STRA|nr:unnamed protein product [Cylindrotheca closterium]